METSVFTHGQTEMAYSLFSPQKAERLLPLVIYLRKDSSDNGAEYFMSEENQKEHPSFVLLPHPSDWTDPQIAQTLQRLIFSIRKQYEMDICRTYLAGQGLGAVGVWHMLGGYPRLFAGALAVGGCGDPYRARNAQYAPVWAFHAADDPAINVSTPSQIQGKRFLAGSHRLIDALRTIGGTLAKYTEVETGADQLPDQVFASKEVRDWLYKQDRKNVMWVYMVRPGIYRIDDWFMSSCYLVVGEERALMIDTAMSHAPLMPLIRQLTHLPVSLAVTHPHMDHMLHAFAFDTVYMHEKDAQCLDACLESMTNMLYRPGMMISTNLVPGFLDKIGECKHVIGLKNRDCIDLGGGVKVEMLNLHGHTDHHVVFVDHAHRCVFTGDAVGSGYVVGVNYKKDCFAETYTWYRAQLENFLNYMEPLGEYTYFGGHFIQENSCDDPMQEDYLNGQSEYYVPLSIEVVKDMKILCDELLEGKHDHEIDPQTGAFFATHGSASLAGRWK